MPRKITVPKSLRPLTKSLASAAKWCGKNLNFFRVHVLVFTFVPLIAAGIFYACNGETHVKFVDCLYVCVSAMTVTGLVTINISTINGGQQAILFILMCFGNISAVSVTMIWIRRSFFRKKFDRVVQRSAKVRKRMQDVEEAEKRERRHQLAKLQRIVGLKSGDSATTSSENGEPDVDPSSNSNSSSSEHIALKNLEKKKHPAKGKRKPLRADMIRRIDGPAFLINSAGDRSNVVPDHHLRHVITNDAAPFTQEPQNADSADPSNIASSGGGILSSSGGGDYNDATDQQQQQQPSIRISLPQNPPSAASASTSAGQMADASADSIPRRTSVIRRLSIPRFTSRHDPDADSDDEVSSQAVADDDGENEDDRDNNSTFPPQTTATNTAVNTPISPALRARFPDSPITNPNAQQLARARRGSDPPRSHFRRGSDTGLLAAYHQTADKPDMFPRAQTVEFSVPSDHRSPHETRDQTYSTAINSAAGLGGGSVRPRGTGFNRTVTGRSYMSGSGRYGASRGVPLARTQTSSKQRGFGGFPTPFELAGFAIKKAVPGVSERFQRTMTMPRTSTITSVRSGGGLTDNTSRAAPYLSFDATVSRNSRFHALTEAQREELGGVEYRALDLLAKLVPAYWLLVNLGMVTMVAPYINSSAFNKYKPVFEAQGQYQPNYTWFWFFQVVSAYSNTGMSLIDTSMTQMRDAYFLLIPMGFLILAGNTGFPIVLRFFIWCISKVVPSQSRMFETLRFLLDHPRRCFVYLFPSGQTWFLFFVLIVFNFTDWFAFLVLDIGNPVIESIPVNIRVFDGLFQSLAVRAAGFTVVSLLALAPAVQFLYVVMMYLSAFPLALSVRSTNVYEEKSLGVYVDENKEPGQVPQEADAKVWGNFLASHARRQLAFDIWWLGFALWLVCIIERKDITDPASDGWFTIFSCLFELTSAYGTVGLSLGTPYDNFSLSGRFHTLSKLVVCAVMIRGRHRGLPVAIDRAILLPAELEQEDMLDDDDYSHIDEVWDRDNTFVDQDLPKAGSMDREGTRNESDGGHGVNGFSTVKRTGSGVSFAIGSPGAGRRGSGGGQTQDPPLSPRQNQEFGGGAGGSEPRRSFSMPPSALPLSSHTGLPLPQPTGQLSAIDEFPPGFPSISENPSRSESPAPLTSSNDPRSGNGHGDGSQSSGSLKGKEKEKRNEDDRFETVVGTANVREDEESQAAHDYGCSTPKGQHDPVTKTDD